MKHCPNCQFDISEARSVVVHSKNPRVKVCSLCGFPVDPRHRKLFDIVQAFQITMVFLLPAIAVIISIFYFQLTWWQVVIVGIVAFLLFLFLLNDLNGFLSDVKIAESYNKKSYEDFNVLIETDDRLAHKREVRLKHHESIERFEAHEKLLIEAQKLVEFTLKMSNDIFKLSRSKSFDEDDFEIAGSHLAKLSICSSMLFHQILNHEITNWSENAKIANYFKEVEHFIANFSGQVSSKNLLPTDQLNEYFMIRKAQVDEQDKIVHLRNEATAKLYTEHRKIGARIGKLYERQVLTKEDELLLFDLDEQAFDAMVKYEISMYEVQPNLSLDATYQEILDFNGSLIEYVNDFIPSEKLSDFWEPIEEMNKFISQVKGRPDWYGRDKNLESLNNQ